jgi:hypothetical protein
MKLVANFLLPAVALAACGGSQSTQNQNDGTSNWTISDQATMAAVFSGSAPGPTIDSHQLNVVLPGSQEMSVQLSYPTTTGGMGYDCSSAGNVQIQFQAGNGVSFVAGNASAGPNTNCAISLGAFPTVYPGLVSGTASGVISNCSVVGGCTANQWTLYTIQGTFSAYDEGP